MKHKIVMRLKIIGSLILIKEELTYLFKHTLDSIIRQTDQDYWCVVQYPQEIEELLNEEKQKYPDIAKKIFFTTSMRDSIKSLLEDENLAGYDDIWFVKLNTMQIYPLNMIEQFNNYMPKNRTRILLLEEDCIYNIRENQVYRRSDSSIAVFIFICASEEYKKHFCVYEYYRPYVLDQRYHLLKNELMQQKVLSIKRFIPNKQLEELVLLEQDEKDKILTDYPFKNNDGAN